MSRSDPTGALFLGTGAGVWIFFKGFRVFREFKIVADTPCMPIRSIPMGLVQVRGQALADQLIPSPITHTPCCFYQVKIEHYETGEHGGWKHYRTDMDGAKFYLQDQTGKVLVDSYSAEYDLPESPPRVVDGAHIAPLMGTGASDEELLQYVHRAGANLLAAKMEHWLEKKGPLDDPKREQGRQTLLDMVRLIPQATTGRGKIPVDLIDKIAAAHPLDDPEKEQHAANVSAAYSGNRRLAHSPVLRTGERALPLARISHSARAGVSRDRDLRGESRKRMTLMTAT